MNKLLRSSALLLLVLLLKVPFASAQTTVYTNAFPGVGGVSPFPGGTPALTFTDGSGNSDVSPGSAAMIVIGGPVGSVATLTDNQLAAAVTVANTLGTTNNGFAYTSAPLAGYATPFNPTLSLNLELLTWTFNMRTSAPASGFAAGQNEAAVVLAATDPNLRSAGNGYAVIYNPLSPMGLQFVRYTGGLSGTVTTLISSSASAIGSPTNYVSVKVIYEHALNQWTMYLRDDGPGAFADPSTGVTVAAGSVFDLTYTSTPMTSFGFYGNYSVTYTGIGPDAQNAYFDSYLALLSCPEIEGGLSTCVGLTTALSHPVAGGTWVSGTPAVATVDVSTGLVTGVTSGTSVITYTEGTCEVTAIVTVNPLPVPPAITGTMSVCMASNTTLAVSPATAGSTWSSSNPAIGSVDATTGVVTGISGGTVRITYRVPTGCFSVATVTVNPTSPISGLPLFCQGDVNPFTDAVPGGTWSSSASAIASVDVSTGVVTSGAIGTAYITYTLPSSCFVTLIVSVNANPSPIAGASTVCEGSSTTLTSGPSGGFWSSSNESVAAITDAGLLVGSTAGTALITYKLSTGCLVTKEITVNPAPSGITGPTTLCALDSATFTNTLAGGSWTSGTPLFATVNAATGMVTGVGPGVARITYTMPTGCFRATTVTINAVPTAIAGILEVCVGATRTLTSSTGGTWASSDITIATVGAGTGVVTGMAANTVRISYSLGTGCRRIVTFTVNPLPAAITGSLTLCTGRTSALGNATTGGTWTSSDLAVGTISTAGVLDGLTTGTTSIAYTLATTCARTVVATVIASPAAIGGTAVVCVGETTTLTNATTPGDWTSSNSTIASVDIATGIVTGAASGTATITFTAGNGCFATRTVTVNALPGAITGTLSVCVNSSTTLNATPAGGTWSNSPAGIGFITGGGVLTGLTNGTTTVTYTRLGCISTAVATVNPLPATIGGTPTVCLGLTTTLTNASTPGTWTSSNTTNAPVGSTTGVVSGNNAGTANITYTLNATGCYRTRSVTVNPLPATIGGPGGLCPATSITLTNSTSGGTWSSSTTAVATIGTATGIVNGIATGTTTISYTIGTGCVRTTVVTVATAPPAIITPIGDTILCPGDFVNLTASTTPGVTYTWFEAGTPIAGATSATYLTSTPGSYQVRVSLAAGCSLISSPMSVTVVPATATITVPGGVTTTCAGTGITLNGNTGAGLTYQWSLGGVAITGATASSYSALAAGMYTVRVTNSAGCWAVSAPVTISVDPSPSNVVTISGPLTICNTSSVTFTAAGGTGYTYQWYKGAVAIGGAVGMSYTATTAGSYHVVITNSIGCATTTAALVVVVNPLPNVGISIGSPLVFCAGGSVALTATPGFQYQWYRGGVALAGATNSAYLATIGGGYRVRLTNLVTGCTDITHADTTVHVITVPVVNPLTPAKFCWGGSALLSTSVSSLSSAIMYQWAFNGVPIPGATNGTYSANAGGLYSCSISVPASCTTASLPVEVTEVPLPDAPITFNGTIFKAPTYFVSYQWYKNLVVIPGATGFSTPATSDGNYKVAVTDTNGCQSVSLVYVLSGWKGTPPPTAVNNVNSTDIKVFPNPATETVYIASEISVRAVISSIDGKVIIDQPNAKEISIRSLADGIYMISLFDEAGQQLKVQKLVKRQ